jgi:hypothetical protein
MLKVKPYSYDYESGLKMKNVGLTEKGCAISGTTCSQLEDLLESIWDIMLKDAEFSIKIDDCE